MIIIIGYEIYGLYLPVDVDEILMQCIIIYNSANCDPLHVLSNRYLTYIPTTWLYFICRAGKRKGFQTY